MYKCNDCGREFDNPKVETELIGVSDKTGIIQYYYCPCCDSSNIDYEGAAIIFKEEVNSDDEE